MNVVGFTDAKRNLLSLLTGVRTSKKPVFIELNGETVAVLSTKPPRPDREIPPMQITVDEARDDWSGILAAVRIEGAYFCFSNKSDKNLVVHLRRYRGYRNAYSERWLEHCRPFLQEAAPQEKRITPQQVHALQEDMNKTLFDIRSDLGADLKSLDEKLKILFTLVNRSGDIYRWEPPRTVDDFELPKDED